MILNSTIAVLTKVSGNVDDEVESLRLEGDTGATLERGEEG